MSRDERTRSLPLLDRETPPGDGRGKWDIGSELFGIGEVRERGENDTPPSTSGQMEGVHSDVCDGQALPLEGNEEPWKVREQPVGKADDDRDIREKTGKIKSPCEEAADSGMVAGQENGGYVVQDMSRQVPVPDSPTETVPTRMDNGQRGLGIDQEEKGIQGYPVQRGQPGLEPESSHNKGDPPLENVGRMNSPTEETGHLAGRYTQTDSQGRWENTTFAGGDGIPGVRTQGRQEYPQRMADYDYARQVPEPPRAGYSYPKLAMPEINHKNFAKKLISIYSPKGGVGKSTISKELAMAYSTASVNGEAVRVLLVDADWEFGDITTLFNVAPRPNVIDWVRDMQADKRQTGCLHLYSNETILSRYVIPYSSTLHILAGPGDPVEAELITEEMVLAMVESLKRSTYDIILIDSANSNRARTLVPIMKSDAVVLVETLDTSTVAETTAVLNTLRSKQFDFGRIYMVLNQVPESDTQIDISVTEISRLLQLDVAAVLPKYELIRMINNAGDAAVRKRASAYSQAMFQLANRIVPLFEGNKKKSLFGFMKRFRKGR